jgi:serine/threonine-protein kinase
VVETGRTLTCPECGKPYLRGAKFCAHCGTLINSLELDLLDLEGGSLPTGTLIGSYRLVELLGEGGMGRVYVAEHIKLGRRVALKKLRHELISNPTAVARFFAEARAVNRISHENIVEITDLLEQPGGDNCIIMELLKGEDLAQRLRRLQTLPLRRALGIAAQTASALAAVHAAGMIHRDLKPDNIFLSDRNGTPDFVKVLDFGVAKLADVNQGRGFSTHTTAAGQIVGTPEYMSPEQARGERVDFRTDIYALGIILYEMVTGVLPFDGKSFGELLMMHMSSPVVLPEHVPGLSTEIQRARDRLILDLLAKRAADRPASMAEVATRLRALLDEMELPRPSRARTAPAVAPDARGAAGTPGVAGTAGVAGVEAVAKLALVKRVTPQIAIEVSAQRSGPRIEVRTPSGLDGAIESPLIAPAAEPQPQPPPAVTESARLRLAKASVARLAKSSSDSQPPSVLAAAARGVLDAMQAEPAAAPKRTAPAATAARTTRDVPDAMLARAMSSLPAAMPAHAPSAAMPAPATPSLPAASPSEAKPMASPPDAKPVPAMTSSPEATPVHAASSPGTPASSSEVRARVTRPWSDVTPTRATPFESVAPPRAARSWRAAAFAAAIGAAIAATIVMMAGGSAPAVAPASAPVVQQDIKLKFVSAPEGATVRRLGTGDPLGVTPFTASLPRSDEPVTFELSKPGFATVTQVVVLATDDALAIALTPLADAPPSAAAVPIVTPATPHAPAASPDRPRQAAPAGSPARAAPPGPARRPPPADRALERNATLDAFQ